jgi:hypothetical protein
MNGMPIPDQGEDEQEKGDEKQAGSLRGVNGVPLLAVIGFLLRPCSKHENIVALDRCQVSGVRFQVLGLRPGSGDEANQVSSQPET